MDAHEELVEAVAICADCSLTEARAIIALIAERLIRVTHEQLNLSKTILDDDIATAEFQAMLRASPLYPKDRADG